MTKGERIVATLEELVAGAYVGLDYARFYDEGITRAMGRVDAFREALEAARSVLEAEEGQDQG